MKFNFCSFAIFFIFAYAGGKPAKIKSDFTPGKLPTASRSMAGTFQKAHVLLDHRLNHIAADF